MTRNVDALLLAYMQGTNARSMTKVVKIGPFQDASFRYLAQTIRTIVYDDGDGEASYVGRTGMQMSTFVSSDSLGVDNAEMDTLPVVSGWPLEGFTQEQVLSGELDGIEYVVYCLDWQRLDLGHFIFSKGRLGETRIRGTALFTFEQRSISNRLKQVLGQVDSISCRADFASVNYGEATDGEREELYPCEYPLAGEWVDFVVTSVHPTDDDLEFNATDLGGFEDFRFAPGLVRWLTGANANTENEVGDFTSDAGEGSVVLSFHSRYAIQAGDTGQIRRSCTFRPHGHNSCADTFWGPLWVLHYRGEPYIPIGDAAGNLVSGAAVAGDVGGTGEFLPPIPTPPPVDPGGGGGGATSTGIPPTGRTRGATVVNVRNYGAVGDGVTNDTAAFVAAYAALPGDGGTVNVPGPYRYRVTTNSVLPLDNTLLNLDDDAIIHGLYTATDHRYVIWIKDVEQVEIAGGEIRGYRDDWAPISGTTSEWGHGIAVDSSSHVTVRDCTISKCVGDGLSIGVFGSGIKPDDVIVDNVLSTLHRRQGFTVGRSTNCRISNCEISEIGNQSGSPGTAPKAGIDNEPDLPDTQSSSGTVIVDNYIHDCDGPGLLVWRSGDDVTATGNIIEYCSYGILLNESTGTAIQGNTIRHNANWGIRLQDDTVGYTIGVALSGDLTLKNSFWNNRTSVHGVDTSPGGTSQVVGQSAATADHIRIESDGSSADVLTNDVIS